MFPEYMYIVLLFSLRHTISLLAAETSLASSTCHWHASLLNSVTIIEVKYFVHGEFRMGFVVNRKGQIQSFPICSSVH